jgi:hypothetical protein
MLTSSMLPLFLAAHALLQPYALRKLQPHSAMRPHRLELPARLALPVKSTSAGFTFPTKLTPPAKASALGKAAATETRLVPDTVRTQSPDTAGVYHDDDMSVYSYDAIGDQVGVRFFGRENDTLVWQQPDWVLANSHDAYGNTTQTVAKKARPDSQIVYVEKHAFDASGRVLVSQYSVWDEELGRMNDQMKDSLAYDGKGRLIAEYGWFGDTAGTLQREHVDLFQFDANGNWEETLEHGPFHFGEEDTSIAKWRGHGKVNARGDEVSAILEIWDDVEKKWVTYGRDSLVYDAGGQLTESYTFTWDDTAKWVNGARILFKYDSHGNEIERNDALGAENGWVDNSRYYQTWDEKGLNTGWEIWSWEALGSVWNHDAKSTMTYNDKGLETVSLSWGWDVESSKWVPGSREVTTYKTIQVDLAGIRRAPLGHTHVTLAGGTTLEAVGADGRTLARVEYRGPETLAALRRGISGWFTLRALAPAATH